MGPCKCHKSCGDVDESHDPHGICKALPRGPQTPLIEVVLVPRSALSPESNPEGQ